MPAAAAASRPKPIQLERMNAQARLDPDRAAHHVLRDDGGRHDQATDESAARRIVAAQQEVHRDQPRQRQQHAHEHGGNPELAGRQRIIRTCASASSSASPRDLECARVMLSGAGRNRRSSAYTMIATMPTTVISPNVSKPRKSTSITFTTLRPPACSSALLRKKGASSPAAGRVSTAKARAAIPHAGDHGDAQDRARDGRARAASWRRSASISSRFGQPSQSEQDQHQGDDFDGDLREREIRRGEPREGQARDEAHAAHHDQRGQPMKLGLQRRADGAGGRLPATEAQNSGSSGVSGNCTARPARDE